MLTPVSVLKARCIPAVVGPVGTAAAAAEPMLLRQAYCSCLALAREHGLKTLAFPAISCGAYGYPVELAAPVALGGPATRGSWTGTRPWSNLVLFSREALDRGPACRRILA